MRDRPRTKDGNEERLLVSLQRCARILQSQVELAAVICPFSLNPTPSE